MISSTLPSHAELLTFAKQDFRTVVSRPFSASYDGIPFLSAARPYLALLAVFEDRLDFLDQGLVPGGTRRSFWGRALPVVKPAPADAKDTAEQPDRMVANVGGYEREFRNHVFAAH